LSASGGAIPGGQKQYTSAPFSIDAPDIVDGAVQITFAFRNDYPGLLEFWGADLFDMNKPGQNLLENGNFSVAGLGSTTAQSWTYTPPASGTGVAVAFFSSGCPAGNCWVDATSGSYDELHQNVRSVVLNQQDLYEISFFVSDPTVAYAVSSWPGGNTARSSLPSAGTARTFSPTPDRPEHPA
jgi:hypothetical protein